MMLSVFYDQIRPTTQGMKILINVYQTGKKLQMKCMIHGHGVK